MKVFEANISCRVSDYLNTNLRKVVSYKEANQKLYNAFGVVDFFEDNDQLSTLIEAIAEIQSIVSEPDRTEYGDFQTNLELAEKVGLFLFSKGNNPEVIIEPTCGKGNFIIASLKNFKYAKNIIGIEIYKPYVLECKFNIIDFYLENPQSNKPDISIIHKSVFDFNFKDIADKYSDKEILVIGNPPWVTNSKLGSLSSSNLPPKTNFKNHTGLDAMTGKGNFDIAEYITLMMIDAFGTMKGVIALLIKNTVVKNILFDQFKRKHPIAQLEELNIDSKKEFNVSVEASLFFCRLNSEPELECEEFDFYEQYELKIMEPVNGKFRGGKKGKRFGWLANKFVSNISTYINAQQIDGVCPFVWRQGLKHDCSSIMELNKVNGHYVNGLNEEINLENDLVYGILKSSDLKNTVIDEPRKYTIVTQKKVGQETNYIKYDYPQTYQYLNQHQEAFNSRKSSIYNNKPPFSIFGVGDYSFKPYKVAISGLYKTFHFTLVLPQGGKPIMLDDTCYMIGFDQVEFAVYSLILLNSANTKGFLKSITFADAKRTFTKDVLMRIDLLASARSIPEKELESELDNINLKYDLNLTLTSWDDFINEMTPTIKRQAELFE